MIIIINDIEDMLYERLSYFKSHINMQLEKEELKINHPELCQNLENVEAELEKALLYLGKEFGKIERRQ